MGEVGPLAGAVEVGHVAAGADRVAVDDDGRVRVELPADRRSGGLVEEGASGGDIALRDERGAGPLESTDLEPAVAEPAADLLGAPAERDRSVEVVLLLRAQCLLEGEVPVLGRLRLVGKEPLRAGEPGIRDDGLQLVRVVVRELGRDGGRLRGPSGLHERGVRALEVGRLLVHVPRPRRRGRSEEEVVGFELFGVRFREEAVCRLPGAVADGLAGRLDPISGDARHERQSSTTTRTGSEMPLSSTSRASFVACLPDAPPASVSSLARISPAPARAPIRAAAWTPWPP